MTGPITTSERGRELAQRSAERRRVLTLSDVEAELPKLTSVENAKARLEKLSDWGAAGLLPGTVLNGAVRAVEVWLKVHEFQAHAIRLKQLEERVTEIERERDGDDWKP